MTGNGAPLRTIDTAERRARLAVRHRLAPGWHGANVMEVARDLVALHATDPATVHLSAAARMTEPSVEAVERALYDDRVLVRLLGMRRTLFVIPTFLVPVVHAAATRAVAANERRRLLGYIAEAGLSEDPATWYHRVADATVAALERRGEALPGELAADVPELGLEIRLGEGTRWPATVKVASRVLTVLAAEERVVRGRPRGAWTSTGYRWAPMSRWLDGEPEQLPVAGARASLARRWLASFGPATAADLKWWAGWTVAATRAALAAVDAVEVDLDGTRGYVLPDDNEPVADPEPWVALLPGLDTTAMGWTGRDWYLDPALRPALFDRSGNVGPTVWSDGRVVGGWAQRRDGEVVVRLLADVGSAVAAEVDAQAAWLTGWLGSARITPRFRTPLERELVA